MRLQSFEKAKRAACVLLAVLILWMTPVCDYLDIRHMKTVDAASIVAGVTAASVLKLTAAAFGVVIATAATSKAVDSFQQWISENGSAESIATWNQAQAEAQELVLSVGFIGDVKRWLQSRFSSLDSGEVESVPVGAGEISNGAVCNYPLFEATFLSENLLDGYQYLYYWYPSVGRVSLCRTQEPDVFCLVFGDSGLQIVQVKDGRIVYPFSILFSEYIFYSDASMGVHTSPRNKEYFCSSFGAGIFTESSSYAVRSTIPVIVTDFSQSVSNGVLFSNVLAHATATYGLDASEHFGTSFGAFSDANASALAGMNLTAADIAKLQGMIDQAVSDNTSAGDDGKPVYSPDIAQAIIDAYKRGLEDAGGGTEDPDTPVNPPVVTPDTGILDFLGGLKDSLQTWITAIPDAVASGVSSIKGTLETGWTTLWGHLTGIKDTLTEIGSTVTTGFEQVVSGVTALPETITGAFADLHQWILDIPGSFSGAFADLQEWIMDIPETFEAGVTVITGKLDAVAGTLTDSLTALQNGISDLADAIPGADAITTPITDAIADALTVDAAAVQTAVEAEEEDLWDLPFLTQAKELFEGFSFPAEVTYPKIKIETPAILRPYYDQPEIILLDFEDYKDYCLWARLLFRASIWLWLVWHIVDLATPRLRIS